MLNFSNQSKKVKPIINKTVLKSSLVAGAFLFSGINQTAQANTKSIVAVEPLVCDVVSAIAPPSTPVTCLIDRKQDVHDVKITPKQAQTLKSANQVFTLGSEMTPAIKKWLDNPLTVVVGVSAIEIDDHDDHDDHGDDHSDHSDGEDHSGEENHSDDGGEIVADEDEEAFDYDPHSWLSPVAYKAQIDVVLNALTTAFPEGEADFKANAEAYSAELDKIDANYTAAFGEGGTCEVSKAEKTIVANHNAYAYISERYDIEILTVHGLDPEGEPSAADIAEVVEQIQEKGITVLYVEEYTDTSSVDVIVEQTGVTIEILYTMELPPKDSEDTYLTLMDKNLQSLVTGMGC